MNRVENYKDHLCLLKKCNKPTHTSIIQSADKELINTICECILNCLNGNVDLSKEDKQKLYRYKTSMRDLMKKTKLPLKKKKQILIQKGSGFLPIILSAVLSLLQ